MTAVFPGGGVGGGGREEESLLFYIVRNVTFIETIFL